MKKTKGRVPGRNGKVYMNLALSNQTRDLYGTRPYGGRNGISNHYPPSKAAFISERPIDFLNDVKNMVFRQNEEERSGSPSWVGKYNKELNHTGEQPLMVQRFLSNNKQEQQDGVLPASSKSQSRFQVDRENEQEYQQGLSLHQYLTATEMPGQSEKLVDVRFGRPTRTSLLRARQRTKTIPGPEKTKLDLRDDIHYLQEQTLKREDKYKSVDVPEDLQPLTDGGESVHQFLVGARYNRAHYRDAKCFNKVGLYVSRENPQHCFLKNGTTQESLLTNRTEKGNNLASFSEVTASELNSLCQSTTSIHSNQKHLQPPSKARQAWATSSIASAPSPTPNDSRESFAISTKDDFLPSGRLRSEADGKSKMDRTHVLQSKRMLLKSAPGQHSSSSVARSTASSCDSCILCKEGSAVKQGVPVHFHGRNIMSAPNRRKWTHHAQRGRSVDNNLSSLSKKGQNADLMLVQQYHLRILGTQSPMNMKDERCLAPDSKVHYSPGRSTLGVPRPKTAAPSSRRNPNRNRNNNNKTDELVEEGMADTASNASKISVHISTGEDDAEEMASPGAEATPRSQDVTVGSLRDGGESMADVTTPRTLDLTDTNPPGTGEEAQDSQNDRKDDLDENLPSEREATDGKFNEMIQAVDAVQAASEVPGSEMMEEDAENGTEDKAADDDDVTNLKQELAEVTLDESPDIPSEDVQRETVMEDNNEKIVDALDVIRDDRVEGHEADVVASKGPADLNNNDQEVTDRFAEPNR